MQYGMISYVVPLSVLADTYNGQPLMYIALASPKKQYMSLYLTLCGLRRAKSVENPGSKSATSPPARQLVQHRLPGVAASAFGELLHSFGVDETSPST